MTPLEQYQQFVSQLYHELMEIYNDTYIVADLLLGYPCELLEWSEDPASAIQKLRELILTNESEVEGFYE